MGFRGRGAVGIRELEARQAKQDKQDFPWLKPGLSRGERVIQFLETLPVTKGILCGSQMRLIESQKRFVRAIYNPAGPDGRRLVRLAVLSEARKNGKTGLVVGLALAHMVGPEAEDRGEIPTAANDREQAGIVFEELEAIIHATPWIAAITNIRRFNKAIDVIGTPPGGKGKGTIYETLTAEAKTKHGLSPSLWIYDELAQAHKRDLLDALQTSQGGRAEPLGIVISTQSAVPSHPLSELIDYGEQVNSGAIDDKTFVCHVYEAPANAGLMDEDGWREANPALGVFRDETDLRTLALRACRLPSFEPAFRNLYLNQRVDAAARAISQADWEACAAAVPLDDLIGKECFGGLDLGSTSDLTAFALYWTHCGAAHVWQWVPAERVAERSENDRVPYGVWVNDGHVIATPGRARDDTAIMRKLVQCVDSFDVREIAYDRWRIEDLQKKLVDEGVRGVPLAPHGQGFKDMAPAFDAFESALLARELKHGGSPVLRWQASNAVVQMDESGNRKPDKRRSSDKIDGIVALIMAMGRAAQYKQRAPDYEIQIF